MWSDIVKKKKCNSIPYKRIKQNRDNMNNDKINDDKIDYFDLIYYGRLESELNPILNRIQFGPVFKHGLTDDIIHYIKTKCNIDEINSCYEECDSENMNN
tara:strand:+ start:92 stop:391 length:300 start_codon:yes stop_codon:yes gene_type:complete